MMWRPERSTALLPRSQSLWREHVMMDYYLEFVFPEKQIRYIAVAENEDTEKDFRILCRSRTFLTNGLQRIPAAR